jgi:pyruvate kinase
MKINNYVLVMFLLLATTIIAQKKAPFNANDYVSFGEKFKTEKVYNKDEMLKKYKKLKKGDTLVVTAGIPIGESNGINSIRVINA